MEVVPGGGTAVVLDRGMDGLRLGRFIRTVLASRVLSGDWDGMGGMPPWEASPGGMEDFASFAERFERWPSPGGGISGEELEKVWKILDATRTGHAFAPFWLWEEAPFLGREKKALLRESVRDYVSWLVSSDAWDVDLATRVRRLTRLWASRSNLVADLRAYARPWWRGGDLGDILRFEPFFPRPRRRTVDVNAIDMGIEYTGEFPLVAGYARHRIFREDDFLGHDRRRRVFENVARDIVGTFGGSSVGETGGITATVWATATGGATGRGRRWTVEWDAISRRYEEGKVLEGSVGDGHLELVTPRFVPRAREVQAVYDVFKDNGISAASSLGGGHLNVDLAPFEGRPRAMARFLSLVHEYRGIISLLFQEPHTFGARPPRVDTRLALKLRDFRGTEDELKGLLYENRYFNSHRGEKTKYSYINMSYYFQDVIPEGLISEDFDIALNSGDPWRRQFRVDPAERRMELRFFKAPKTPWESALQIRLVRALLDKAFNEDAPLSGVVQRVDNNSYLDDPRRAYDDLGSLCLSLDLDCRDYRPLVVEGLHDAAVYRDYFKFFDRPEEVENGWGRALERARPRDRGIGSQGRSWDGREGVADGCLRRLGRILGI